MSWMVRDHHRHKTTVRKGAVPLGQHSHHPDEVMPVRREPSPVLAAGPAGEAVALPASPDRRCAACPAPAALVEPASGRAYCAGCWIACVVQNQLD